MSRSSMSKPNRGIVSREKQRSAPAAVVHDDQLGGVRGGAEVSRQGPQRRGQAIRPVQDRYDNREANVPSGHGAPVEGYWFDPPSRPGVTSGAALSSAVARKRGGRRSFVACSYA